MKIPCGRLRDVSNPYETYKSLALPGWEWRVLKKYQSPENEKKNPYARWFCAVRSPMTYGDWEYGDTYVREILIDARAFKVYVLPKNAECDLCHKGLPTEEERYFTKSQVFCEKCYKKLSGEEEQ